MSLRIEGTGKVNAMDFLSLAPNLSGIYLPEEGFSGLRTHHPPQSVYWCLFLGGLRLNQKRNQSMRCASFSPIILLACQGPLKLPNSMFIDYSTILNHPTKKLRLPLLLLRLVLPRWKTSPNAVVIDDEGHRFEWQLRGYSEGVVDPVAASSSSSQDSSNKRDCVAKL